VENFATGHREIIGAMFDTVFPDNYRHAINSLSKLETIKNRKNFARKGLNLNFCVQKKEIAQYECNKDPKWL
jgi:hypothetical protein